MIIVSAILRLYNIPKRGADVAQEILSIKLYELEEQITRLLARIQLSQHDNHAQLQQAIEELKRECEENELALKNRLQLSRSGIVSTIRQSSISAEKRSPGSPGICTDLAFYICTMPTSQKDSFPRIKAILKKRQLTYLGQLPILYGIILPVSGTSS